MAIKTTTTVITLIIPLVRLLQGANSHIHSIPRGKKIIRRLMINTVLWYQGLVRLSTVRRSWGVGCICRIQTWAKECLVIRLILGEAPVSFLDLGQAMYLETVL
jgi:hypothetical protein